MAPSKELTKEELEKFDWITLKKDMDSHSAGIETQTEKLKRKFAENPLVPIGCLATTAALSYGIWCFRSGQRKRSQLMMRARILAQGFTLVAMIVGVAVQAKKTLEPKTNE
ncbi:unnamed protein product [Phyllotreta striolata]|uniref:HIG1 domain-containing protein n=1 Tax=Phyllotreta striolata TaxID=444603 RepID=A0A9N9TP23_PHYSR|nr:unnamed protein product [Phyllotreta striolata]